MEDALLQHEAVAEASVFGIKDEGGDIPRAVVVLKHGKSATPEEIQAFADGKSYTAIKIYIKFCLLLAKFIILL